MRLISASRAKFFFVDEDARSGRRGARKRKTDWWFGQAGVQESGAIHPLPAHFEWGRVLMGARQGPDESHSAQVVRVRPPPPHPQEGQHFAIRGRLGAEAVDGRTEQITLGAGRSSPAEARGSTHPANGGARLHRQNGVRRWSMAGEPCEAEKAQVSPRAGCLVLTPPIPAQSDNGAGVKPCLEEAGGNFAKAAAAGTTHAATGGSLGAWHVPPATRYKAWQWAKKISDEQKPFLRTPVGKGAKNVQTNWACRTGTRSGDRANLGQRLC